MLKIESKIQVNTYESRNTGFSIEVLKRRLYGAMIEEMDKSDCFSIQETKVDFETFQYDLSTLVMSKKELSELLSLLSLVEELLPVDAKQYVGEIRSILIPRYDQLDKIVKSKEL